MYYNIKVHKTAKNDCLQLIFLEYPIHLFRIWKVAQSIPAYFR